jgi:hypothetical protein
MADLSIHKLYDLALERAVDVRQAGTKSLWIDGWPLGDMAGDRLPIETSALPLESFLHPYRTLIPANQPGTQWQ